jgi:hypothetical protein
MSIASSSRGVCSSLPAACCPCLCHPDKSLISPDILPLGCPGSEFRHGASVRNPVGGMAYAANGSHNVRPTSVHPAQPSAPVSGEPRTSGAAPQGKKRPSAAMNADALFYAQHDHGAPKNESEDEDALDDGGDDRSGKRKRVRRKVRGHVGSAYVTYADRPPAYNVSGVRRDAISRTRATLARSGTRVTSAVRPFLARE